MHRFTVQDVKMLTDDVALLTIAPRSESDRLVFYPGQYATIGFTQGGRPTPMRCFSIVSSPRDTRALQFAMRVQGKFTQMISRLSPGDEAFVQGPFGSLILDPDYDKRVVMLAGGIGITPFISMLRHAAATKLQTPITLLYAVSSLRNIPFYEELLRLEQAIPNFRVGFFVSGEDGQPLPSAKFMSGRVNEEWLDKVTGGNYAGITYFVCGPKGFMRAQQKTLEKKGVNPNRIVTESFTQASKLSFGGLSIPKLAYGLTGAAMALGFFFFMAIDLVRFMPKTASVDSSGNTSSSAVTTPNTSSSVGGTDSSSSNGSTSTSDTSSTAAPSSSSDSSTSQSQVTTPTYNYRYQQPVSRVS